MQKVFLTLLLLFNVLAQAQDITWYKGSVVFADQQVALGEISIQTDDLILFRNNQRSDAIPAPKIQSVRYYDEIENINRKFIALQDGIGAHQFRLYEMVSPGKLTILRKQKARLINGNPSTDVFAFDYFVVVDNNLTNLRHFSKKIYPDLIADRESLHQFVKTQKLDPGNIADAIRIIMFYNNMNVIPTLASLQR